MSKLPRVDAYLQTQGVRSIYNAAYADEYPALYLHPWSAKHELNLTNIQKLVEELGPADNQRWLDIACGQGWQLAHGPHGIQKTGLDISSAQLHHARIANPMASFVCGDMSRRVFRAHSFNLVTSFWGAYCYLKTRTGIRSFLRHAVGYTKPGGALYLEVLLAEDLESFNHSKYAGKTGFSVSPLSPDYSRWSYRDCGGEHLMMSPPLEFFRDILSASFDHVEAEHDGRFMIHVTAQGRIGRTER